MLSVLKLGYPDRCHNHCFDFKFPLAPIGAIATGSAHAIPSAQAPIDTKGNFSAQVFGGGWGGQKINLYSKSYFFCDLKPHAKFGNPTITPTRRKVTISEEREKERKKEKKKNAVNSGHLVS